MHKQHVRVAGGVADIETGKLLVIKRSLCPIIFCNYKCLNIGLFPNSDVFYSFICKEATNFLQADCGLSLRATRSFVVGDVI